MPLILFLKIIVKVKDIVLTHFLAKTIFLSLF